MHVLIPYKLNYLKLNVEFFRNYETNKNYQVKQIFQNISYLCIYYKYSGNQIKAK